MRVLSSLIAITTGIATATAIATDDMAGRLASCSPVHTCAIMMMMVIVVIVIVIIVVGVGRELIGGDGGVVVVHSAIVVIVVGTSGHCDGESHRNQHQTR